VYYGKVAEYQEFGEELSYHPTASRANRVGWGVPPRALGPGFTGDTPGMGRLG